MLWMRAVGIHPIVTGKSQFTLREPIISLIITVHLAFLGYSLTCRDNRRIIHSCAPSSSVTSDMLQPFGLSPAGLLCPWDFSGKNTGMGCYFLLQGIFQTWIEPRSPCLLHSGSFFTHWVISEAPLCAKVPTEWVKLAAQIKPVVISAS